MRQASWVRLFAAYVAVLLVITSVVLLYVSKYAADERNFHEKSSHEISLCLLRVFSIPAEQRKQTFTVEFFEDRCGLTYDEANSILQP